MNGLNHNARYPESRVLSFSFLVVLVVFEAVLNSTFFAKGSELGYLGGWFQAAVIAVANVGISALAGARAIPYFHHIEVIKRSLAFAGLVFYVAVIFAFNLAIAHYRVLLEQSPDTAVIEAIPHMYAAPFAVDNIDALALFLIGILFSILAFIDGYFWFDDHYPGYGSVDRAYRKTLQAYDEGKTQLRNEMERIAQSAVETIDRITNIVMDQLAKCKKIENQYELLVKEFERSAEQIERICHELLALYRGENCAVRTTAAPGYFANYPDFEQATGPFQDFGSKIGKYIEKLKQDISLIQKQGNAEKADIRKRVEEKLENLSSYIDDIENIAEKKLKENELSVEKASA